MPRLPRQINMDSDGLYHLRGQDDWLMPLEELMGHPGSAEEAERLCWTLLQRLVLMKEDAMN